MDHTLMENLYVDEEYGSVSDQAFISQIDNRLKQLHTALPGIIKSFDGYKASVQPTIMRVFVDKGPQPLPLIEDVPVVFPGSGDWSVTFPINPGDECLVIFLERAMDYWYKSGGIQAPSRYRLHDLSDAVCIPGLRSLPNKLPAVQTDGIELRNRDRSTFLKLTAAGIQIKATSVAITGNVSVTGDIVAGGKSLQTHLHADPQGGDTGPPE